MFWSHACDDLSVEVAQLINQTFQIKRGTYETFRSDHP